MERLTLCIRQSKSGPINTSAIPINGEDKDDLSYMPLRFSLATCMDADLCDTVRHCAPCGSTTRDRVPTRHNLFLLTALQDSENRRAVSIRLNPLKGTVSQGFWESLRKVYVYRSQGKSIRLPVSLEINKRVDLLALVNTWHSEYKIYCQTTDKS